MFYAVFSGCVGPMISDTIDLGISLLRGGNIDVQKVRHTCTVTQVLFSNNYRTKELLIFRNCQRLNVSYFIFLYNTSTPQPLYNTIVGVQRNFRVSYPIRAISRVKCIVI